MSDVAIRVGQPADHPLIFNSWLKSFRDSPICKGVPNTQFYAGHHSLIERSLPLSMVRVACDVSKPTEIYGYAVAQSFPEGLCLHWIYVKHAFRGFGIAKLLEKSFEATIASYSHRVKNMERMLKDRNYIYNPYYFYR